jgi:hypothetical protein
MERETVYTEYEARIVADCIVNEYLDWVLSLIKEDTIQRPIFDEMWNKYKKK